MLDKNCGWEKEHNCLTYALRHVTVCVTRVVGCGCLRCKWMLTCIRYMWRAVLSHVLCSSWQIKAPGTDVTSVCPEKSPHGNL